MRGASLVVIAAIGCGGDGAHPTSHRLFDGKPATSVWAFAADDVWVGGPALAHWDGRTWTDFTTVPDAMVSGMWGLAPDDLYVTTPGALLHWDGARWAILTADLFSHCCVYATSATNAWLGTDILGNVFRWDGHDVVAPFSSPNTSRMWGTGSDVFALTATGVERWSESDRPTDQPVSLAKSFASGGIWGTGLDDVWAAAGTTLAHSDGAAWTTFQIEPSSDGKGSWSDLAGNARDNVWAMSSDGSLWHYDGGTWDRDLRVLSFEPFALHVAEDGTVWLAGQSTVDGAGLVIAR
jgi:hypothetical protein